MATATATGGPAMHHAHPGTAVWVRRPAGAPGGAPEWAPGVVAAADAAGVVVRVEGAGEVAAPAADVHLRAADEGVQDLIRLTHLNEPSVLAALTTRYGAGAIYTQTGPSIVIAVNPFRPVPGLYDAAAMERYRCAGAAGGAVDGAAEAGGAADGAAPPHVFSVASQAYWRMRREGKGQALLVTGESGAGKTETSKLIMKYLAYLGGYQPASSGGGSSSGSESGAAAVADDAAGAPGCAPAGSVEQRVLESNPLLEAFGNAKTVRNDNSSRFGKYIELHFSRRGAISGARIHTYLLERSRLVHTAKGERNFHIFYQLLAGATPEERARWHLGPGAASHRLAAAAGCVALPGVDDAADLETTRHAMRAVGIGPAEQERIFSLLSALVHLGDLEFAPCPRDGDDACALPEAGARALASAAALLGVEAGALLKAVTTRTRVTPDGPIVSPLGARAASDTRDALSKVVYARLFDWLVARINAAIGEDPARASTIGLLDIYGFESFEFNDLEQFCINLANEKLQQHFNHHVFKQEQAAYEHEGIDWSYIDFVDNADVLELIEGRMGLLDLLDEACRFNSTTPRDLADKLLATRPTAAAGAGAAGAAAPRLARAKRHAAAFCVSHYAGPVTYRTDNMLDKNRDFVIAEHRTLLASASCALLAELFGADAAAADGAAGGGAAGGAAGRKGFQFVSVGSQFKRQLAELASKLSQLHPHYVRCIKPNPAGVPAALDSAYTLEQLKCGGIMEAVRIANAGYPLRRGFGEFVDAFWPLAPHLWEPRLARRRAPASDGAGASSDADRDAAGELLRAAERRAPAALRQGADWQVGRSMVFLRATAAGALSRMLAQALDAAAVSVQSGWRGAVARREAARARAAVLRLQAGARGMLARAEARRRREARAAAALQAAWRGLLARRELAAKRAAAVATQTAWRAHVARARFLRLRAAALTLQAGARGAIARAEARRRREARAATAVQAAWRAAAARRALAAARGAATALQAAWRGRAARADFAAQWTPEKNEAARTIQKLWRRRHVTRSRVLRLRLQRAFIAYADLWHSATALQCAWRRHAAVKKAQEMRDELRRATFRRNAAMFQSMAAAAASGAKPRSPAPRAAAPRPAGGRPPSPRVPAPKPAPGGRSVVCTTFRIAAVPAPCGAAPSSPTPAESAAAATAAARLAATWTAPGGYPGYYGSDGVRASYADVVKGDSVSHLPSGERLQQRIGELRERAKVTSLLGVWQQRLQQQQQQRAAAQRSREVQMRQREHAVWQRQQQLMRLHQQRQRLEAEAAELSARRAASGYLGAPARPHQVRA
ncbi:hypothetical protein Rsub_05643 [Raphidocelis subcapitata]|uniref:Myosin motor domain-containing protein n=1 Tax=Raphidocelis subcapitata TaxID=307507 RepID=A0A2V0P2B1_9CHLO|nr:hypothetical protein Rsub_05643 [Raphidocelis subcapitata]|eukprot:GBF93032.1 hypothetical protein Rsub_05643 [Raphidocelis subcapitata]